MPVRTSPPSARSTRARANDDNDRLSPLARTLVAVGVGFAFLVALVLGFIVVWAGPSGGAATAGAFGADGESLVIPLDRPRQLTDFSLTDQRGRQVGRPDLRDKIVVVNFLFTSCSIVCPYVSAQMEKVQKASASLPNVRLLSLTLDPADDTRDVLATYAHDFNADPARWFFLTGDEAALRRLIGTSFLETDTSNEFASMPGNFAHSQRIALVDPRGQVVGYFDGLNQNAGDAVISRIRQMEAAP